MNKLLDIELLIDEDSSTISLKELVDEINKGKDKEDRLFYPHTGVMKWIDSLVGLENGFDKCPELEHYYSNNNDTSQTIETYALNYKQATTVTALLNDEVLLWVMKEFKRV